MFAAFLITLSRSKEEDLFELFSCSTCEGKLADGSKRMDGVVMDGSAVAIVGKLPNLDRVANLVNTEPRVSDKQLLFHRTRFRGWEKGFSEKKNGKSENCFCLHAAKLQAGRENLFVHVVFYSSASSVPPPPFRTHRFLLTCRGNG